jgi:hypothetical protein
MFAATRLNAGMALLAMDEPEKAIEHFRAAYEADRGGKYGALALRQLELHSVGDRWGRRGAVFGGGVLGASRGYQGFAHSKLIHYRILARGSGRQAMARLLMQGREPAAICWKPAAVRIGCPTKAGAAVAVSEDAWLGERV